MPFNVVDEAVHVLETEAEPWSIQVEARVSGTIDEARLREAVTTAAGHHPMARARKAPTGRRRQRRYAWEITPQTEVDPLRVVDCADDAALAAARVELQSLPVPLAESPPLRLRLARHPAGDVVMLNVNHAASDGVGSLRFLRSVARAYAGAPDPLPAVDPLEARQLEPLVRAPGLRTKVRRAALLADKLGDLVVAPARVATDPGSDRPGYGFHQVSLSPAETGAVVAPGRRGTVNDLLLGALHLAIAAWNDEHGVATRRIGVLVPINMRPREWRHEVMANLLLPLRVATRGRDRSGPATLMEAITAQTGRARELGTGAALIEVLSRSAALPLGVKEALSPVLWLTGNRLVDTALLSNLGRLDDVPTFGPDAGETVEVWFSAPARMPLGLSLGALTAGGRLHLAFRYRHALFDADAARRFADRYLAALWSVVA